MYYFAGKLITNSLNSIRSLPHIHAFSTEYLLSNHSTLGDWLYKNRRIYRMVIAVTSNSILPVLNKVKYLDNILH